MLLTGLIAAAQAQSLTEQPPDPRRQTDFSAFTVDEGQWRVGLSSLDYGLTDNAQIGTNTLLWVLGPNARAKVTAVELGEFSFSFQGGIFKPHQLWTDVLTAAYDDDGESASGGWLRIIPLRGQASWTLSSRWSLHAGSSWTLGRLEGELTGDQIVGMMAAITGGSLDGSITDALGADTLYAGAIGQFTLTQGHLAVEWRRSRRDSIIFQSNSYVAISGLVAGTVGTTSDTGEVGAGVAATFEQALSTFPSAVSLSWQWSWEKFNLRLGIPLNPTNPFSTTQAVKLYWLL